MTKRATRYFKAKKSLKEFYREEAIENLLERYYENNLGEKELDDYLESWFESPSIYNAIELIDKIKSSPLDIGFTGIWDIKNGLPHYR